MAVPPFEAKATLVQPMGVEVGVGDGDGVGGVGGGGVGVGVGKLLVWKL